MVGVKLFYVKAMAIKMSVALTGALLPCLLLSRHGKSIDGYGGSRVAENTRVGWGYSVQKRCFFRHFFDFYKDFEKNYYLMVSYS